MLIKVSQLAVVNLAEKSGMVNSDAFFTMLELHQVILTAKEINKLKHQFQKGDKIRYKDAVNTLRIDKVAAGMGEE